MRFAGDLSYSTSWYGILQLVQGYKMVPTSVTPSKPIVYAI